MAAPVVVSSHARPGVAVVTLSRPEQHNALNRQLITELAATLRSLGERGDIRAIVLTGSGRSFCAGADLQEARATSDSGYDLALEDGQRLFDLLSAIDGFPAPVVVRVNGSAIGGGMGLVACGDIVVAAERARFGFSEVRLGLVPAVISPFVEPKIGSSRMRELFLTGERFDAKHAHSIGLVHWVVSEANLDAKVDDRLEQLLLGAPGAQAAAKKLVQRLRFDSLESLRGYTGDLFARRITSAEGREGMQSFLAKRKPDWVD